MFIDDTTLLFIVGTTIMYVIYTTYLLYKNKKPLTEIHERKISTFILVMIFFSLSMIYDVYMDSHLFVAIWLLYTLWNIIKETKHILSPRRDRRSTDHKGKSCLTC